MVCFPVTISGQSINIENRFKRYKWHNCKKQILISRSIDKYGFTNHVFEIVEECEKDQLNKRERYWQEYYDVLDKNKGLNLRYTETNDRSGCISQESKNKISIANKGKKRTEQERLEMSIRNKGKKLPEKTRKKISNGVRNAKKNKNNIISNETRRKISISLKDYYKYNTSKNKGKTGKTINNKLNPSQVLEIRELLIKKNTVLEISRIYNVSAATIQQIKSGKTWQSLGEFKIKGSAPLIKPDELKELFRAYSEHWPVKEIKEKLGFGITTIAKYRKIWKQNTILN